MSFQQQEHPLLVIPGPIEVHDSVLFANAAPSASHTSPGFSKCFQDVLKMLRQVLYTKDGQPFVVAGSGTLGWDMVSANLLEPGENALVLNSGYFGDSFAECLETYGGKVDQLKAPIGDKPSVSQIEQALKAKQYKLLTFTHVDTSTGVLSDAKEIGEIVKRVSPDTLVILDGVCALGSEEIRFDEWGIDVVVAASQKGLGCPPGLSITCASQKALKVLENRKSPVTSYFASWKKWLPVHQAYDQGQAAYFATPPVQLVMALQASLKLILQTSVSLEDRFAKHKEASQKIKSTVTSLGLKQVPSDPNTVGANGMTAVYAPEGIAVPSIVGGLASRGIVVAAGLHKDIKTKYFRIGHMGVSVVDEERGDVEKIIKGLKETMTEVSYKPCSSPLFTLIAPSEACPP